MRTTLMIGAVLVLVLASILPAHADEETLRWKLRMLENSPSGVWSDYLPEIGELMRDLQGEPPPEEFYRRMARGAAAVESANDQDGFGRAADEFLAATEAAPWQSQAYYNLGIVQDKAGQYEAAMRNLSIYLAANPGSSDAAAVRELLYKIEYRWEQAATQSTQETEAEQQRQEEERLQQEEEIRAAEERRQQEQHVASLLGRWDIHCGSSTTPMRLQPVGPFSVQFEMWSDLTQRWGAQTAMEYEPSARLLRGEPNFSGDILTLTVIGDNQLRYEIGSYVCPVGR